MERDSTALMVSVYRAFREALMLSYPKLDVAINVLRDKREGTYAWLRGGHARMATGREASREAQVGQFGRFRQSLPGRKGRC